MIHRNGASLQLFVLAALSSIACVGQPLEAAIILDDLDRAASVIARGVVTTGTATMIISREPYEDFDGAPPGTAPYMLSAEGSRSGPGGAIASSSAEQSGSTNFNSTADTLSVTVSGNVIAMTDNGSPPDGIFVGTGASAENRFSLNFTLTERPYRYQISVSNLTATSDHPQENNSVAVVDLTGRPDSGTTSVTYFERFVEENGFAFSDGSLFGTLEPGNYRVSAGGNAFVSVGQSDARFGMNFTLTPLDVSEIVWSNPLGGTFGTASNWSPQEVPGSNDMAIFGLGATYTVDVNSASTNRLVVRGGNPTLNIAGTYIASELSTQMPSVAIEQNGNLTIRAGQLRSVHASIGGAATADPATTAKVQVSRLGGVASEWISSGNLAIGGLGAGQLTVNMGGFVQSGSATIGGIPGRGDVLVSGDGSKWVSGNLQIARNAGAGSLTIENKGQVQSAEINIGRGGEGQVNVRSGSSLSASTNLILDGLMNVGGVGPGGIPAAVTINEDLTIGFNRSGTLRVEDGGNVVAVSSKTSLGDHFDSQIRVSGMASGARSGLTVDELRVGWFAKGEVTVENGGFLITGKAEVGSFLGDGRVTMEGRNGTQSSEWDTESLVIGPRFGLSSATAEVHVKAGGSLSVGQNTQGDLTLDGVLTVAGAGGTSLLPSAVNLFGDFDIGFNRAGTLRVEDGGQVISLFNKVIVGNVTDATVHISGVHAGTGTPSIFTAGSELTVALAGKATITVENGGGLISGKASVGSTAADGIVTIRGVNGSHRSEWHVTGNLLLGTSELAMGAVSVENGALLKVDGALLIGPNGRLQGEDRVMAGSISNVGFVAPEGNSPGILTLDSDYTQSDTGRLHIEIGGFTPGVRMDQLIVTGDVTLGGTLVLQFIDGFAPKRADTFNFLSAGGSILGNFDNIEIRNLQAGFEFDLARSPNGQTLSLIALNDGVFVPEPATLTLFVVAAVLLCRRRSNLTANKIR